MLEEIVRCKACLQRNRVRSTVGTKAIRCGRCKDPLATPAILERLEKIKDEIVHLDQEFSWFTVPSRRAELEWALSKQEKTLRILPDYPGYRYTRLASMDLCVEIELKAERLRKRLGANVFAVAKRILDGVIATLRRDAPAALLRGFSGGLG